MGKVLVEKLLYVCNEIGNLYILMRPKRGRTPEQRIEDIWKLPVFSRLRESNPNAIKKIIPLHGDLCSDNLGLTDEDLKTLINDVSIVFHCAATLKLEATLKDAVEQNTTGTKRVVDVAKQLPLLEAFIHTSTAFCSVDIDVFEEKLYPCKDNPRDVIDVVSWINEDALNEATKKLIAPHPNTYTYSKRLAETLVANEAGGMRVAIVRPSIVTPAAFEPVPGWVDSLNGPMGITVAAGKGVLRSMHCHGEYNAQVVPVDMAISAMIIVAYELGSAPERPKEVPVYNLTNNGVIQITWFDILNKGKAIAYKYPFEMMVWYPDGNLRNSKLWHQICCIFLHWIPAYIIDFLMLILLQKRFMLRIQRKIHDGLDLLQFFTTRQWDFASERFLALYTNLDPVDRTTFNMDFLSLPIDEYLKNCVLGARQYCMKEDLKSLPRCRMQQSILYVLDRAIAYAFYFYIIWFVITRIDKAIDAFDFIGSTVKNVPILGSFVHTN